MSGRSDNLKKQLQDAIGRLKDAIEKGPDDDIVIDATIKRFELVYELNWKYLKQELEKEGLVCSSPRQCFKEALTQGWISDEVSWMNMIEDRNLLVHTYSQATLREIYERINSVYFDLLESITSQ